MALCSATLLRDAVDYHLHLSVLLKGTRGTGKFTTACWVAQRMGMHLLEVTFVCHVQVPRVVNSLFIDKLLRPRRRE